MVRDLTPRTIAAKRDGTEAFPPLQAAGPRLRGDRLRALARSSLTGTRADIGRAAEVRRGSVGLPWGATAMVRGPAISFRDRTSEVRQRSAMPDTGCGLESGRFPGVPSGRLSAIFSWALVFARLLECVVNPAQENSQAQENQCQNQCGRIPRRRNTDNNEHRYSGADRKPERYLLSQRLAPYEPKDNAFDQRHQDRGRSERTPKQHRFGRNWSGVHGCIFGERLRMRLAGRRRGR